MAASESVASCSARDSASSSKITVIQLGHNDSNYDYKEKQVNIAEYDRMLTDPGQVDCPLLEKLGYPVMLVHTRHGTKCIPQVQVFAASSNPHNNRQATVAAARLSTGLAMGCVVGEVYALRRDTKSLTGPEWEILRDALDQLMNDYGVGPGYVDEALLRRYRRDTRDRMRGLSDTPPGNHCLECGEEEAEGTQLLRCGNCKTAYYCSKACQKAHWRAGHKAVCRPPGEGSTEAQVAALLASTALRPEQIIARGVPVPELPRGLLEANPHLAAMASAMPPEVHRLFVYNKHLAGRERICPHCRTKYRLLDQPEAGDRASIEQRLSGLCSYACFQAFHPAGSWSGPEWYGQEAIQPEGMTFALEMQ
ncbi:hypothetical protein OEZ85_000919 [Tetradesmus obliquus]|uniref:MYND-type domain-containing protein n=1 Tax=Tetradesmus obliquus TaxID=3088 RepID=A0ABY8UJQ4_TETOB|nr:hypothetical protein OEZ85_000919 [Tetradesmus obliquus]